MSTASSLGEAPNWMAVYQADFYFSFCTLADNEFVLCIESLDGPWHFLFPSVERQWLLLCSRSATRSAEAEEKGEKRGCTNLLIPHDTLATSLPQLSSKRFWSPSLSFWDEEGQWYNMLESLFICLFVCFGPHQTVLRAYSWLNTQRSYVLEFKNHIECWDWTQVNYMQCKFPTCCTWCLV